MNHEHHQIAKNNRRLKWISLSLLGITMISVILVSSIIWFFTYRRHKAGFQPVPPNASNV
jgi:plastocyanin domain-containing protein